VPWLARADGQRDGRGPFQADLAVYTDALSRLFAAARKVSGARVVVDSSKIPTHTLVLHRTAGVDIRQVHLVRDSRGVAFSNTKQVTKRASSGEPTLLPRYGAVAAAARYDFHNGLTGWTRRLGVSYLRLRYEDLIAEPEACLRTVLAHAGEDPSITLPFLAEGRVLLGENHLVEGNPVRFSRGTVALLTDDQWRTRLPSRARRTVTVLTLPLLAAYGYPIGHRSTGCPAAQV